MVKRALAVDDQESIRSLLASFFDQLGAESRLFEDGESAIQHLDKHPNHYEVVLLDLDFGPHRMHGLDVLKTIRERHPDLPVIILTGQATISTAVEAMQLGAQHFVEKDFYIEEELEKALKQVMVWSQKRQANRATRQEETQRIQRLEREVQDAQAIQRSILPPQDIAFPGLDISSYFQPATEVGGDYYDYIPLKPAVLGLAVGDAQGHGLPAGLLVSTASSSLHTVLETTHSVGEILNTMNRRLYEVRERTFMSFCFSRIDVENRQLAFSSAGHHPPYHFSATKQVLLAWPAEGNFPLGVSRQSRFRLNRRALAPGDVLVYYSDGLVECGDASQEPFGYDRLEEVIQVHAHQAATEIKNAITEQFASYCEGSPLSDDVTLVVVRIL